MNHLSIGSQGERVARLFCIRKGWQIRDTNWRAGRGELDIVAQDKDTTIFIEVKSRTSHTFGFPEEALTPHKQGMLRKTISAYCTRFNVHNFRVDVICVHIHNKKARIEHLRDIELLPN